MGTRSRKRRTCFIILKAIQPSRSITKSLRHLPIMTTPKWFWSGMKARSSAIAVIPAQWILEMSWCSHNPPPDRACTSWIQNGQLFPKPIPATYSSLRPIRILKISLANNTAPVPREAIYGPEPARRWCFYYEKMDLAIQEGNWGQAAALGNKAIGLGLHPEDQSEWLPVLKVYAMQDDMNGIKTTIPKINARSIPASRGVPVIGQS